MNSSLKNHVSDDLLNKLIDINHHYIESENPEHHWHLLEVKDQVVLDLGCGFYLLESGWNSTPEYFINKGAKSVIGIDPECSDIRSLQQKLPNNTFICDMVDSTEKINRYINDYKITSLKMDIEGYEKYFLESKDNFETLKHVAIESHDKKLLNDLIVKLLDLNFKITTVCTFYPRAYNICNLIYANR